MENTLSKKATREAEDLLARSVKYINGIRSSVNHVYLVVCVVLSMRVSLFLMNNMKMPGTIMEYRMYSAYTGAAVGFAAFAVVLTGLWFFDLIASMTIRKKQLAILEAALNKYLGMKPDFEIREIRFKAGSEVLLHGFREFSHKDLKTDIIDHLLIRIPNLSNQAKH